MHFLKAINFTSAFILVTLFIVLDVVHGFSEKNVINSPRLTRKIGTNRTVIVYANGQGDYKSVQAAVDHVPNGNSDWIIIHITKGVYREKVNIPRNKPYIFMRGDGRGKTCILWSQSSVHNYDSATFKVEAPHFVAFGISIKNYLCTNYIDGDSVVKSLTFHYNGSSSSLVEYVELVTLYGFMIDISVTN